MCTGLPQVRASPATSQQQGRGLALTRPDSPQGPRAARGQEAGVGPAPLPGLLVPQASSPEPQLFGWRLTLFVLFLNNISSPQGPGQSACRGYPDAQHKPLSFASQRRKLRPERRKDLSPTTQLAGGSARARTHCPQSHDGVFPPRHSCRSHRTSRPLRDATRGKRRAGLAFRGPGWWVWS